MHGSEGEEGSRPALPLLTCSNTIGYNQRMIDKTFCFEGIWVGGEEESINRDFRLSVKFRVIQQHLDFVNQRAF
jgi:hypothetical protein